MTTSFITSHVLDTARGCPASGITVTLSDDSGKVIDSAVTDDNGRVSSLGPEHLDEGTYRILFDTGSYFAREHTPNFFPEVTLTVSLRASEQHYHVPLLLSPYSFSSYRGN